MFHFPPFPSFSSSSFYFMNQICLEDFFSTPSNLGLQVEVEMGLLFCCGSLNLLGYFCLYICCFHLSSVFMDVSLLGYSIELELLHWTRVCWTRDVILINSLKIVLTKKIVLFCKKKKKNPIIHVDYFSKPKIETCPTYLGSLILFISWLLTI